MGAVSDVLRDAIARSGKPLMTIAAESGVERTALTRFYSGGRSLRLEKAEALAAYFGLELASPRGGRGKREGKREAKLRGALRRLRAAVDAADDALRDPPGGP